MKPLLIFYSESYFYKYICITVWSAWSYTHTTLFSYCIILLGSNRLQVNCKNTFEGIFHFTYEQQNSEGICNNPENRITACQEPGSAFKDNDVFRQVFRKCSNAASVDLGRFTLFHVCLRSQSAIRWESSGTLLVNSGGAQGFDSIDLTVKFYIPKLSVA